MAETRAPDVDLDPGAISITTVDVDTTLLRLLCSGVEHDAVRAWADATVHAFDLGPIYFPLHCLDTDAVETTSAILRALADSFARRGLPDASPELDPQRPGRERFDESGFRIVLPHHDGQHCTYLTPSRLDVPSFDPANRVFSLSDNAVTSHKHKIVQGIVIEDTGEGRSETTYYNFVRIVFDAYERKEAPAGGFRIRDVATWLGDNINKALLRSTQLDVRYLSLGAALGLPDPALSVPQLFGEQRVPAERKQRVVGLSDYVATCPCGMCRGEGERLFCWTTTEALGLTATEFREKYELKVTTKNNDLVLADNLALLHGQWQSHWQRRLTNVYLTIERPDTTAYEAHLANRWRTFAPRVGADLN